MIYCCEDCGFLFRRVGEVRECPSCEGSRFRPATAEEEKRLQAMGLENSSNHSYNGYYYKDGYGNWIDYCTFNSTKAATYSETKKERGSQEVQDVVDEIKSKGVTPKGGITFNIRPSTHQLRTPR